MLMEQIDTLIFDLDNTLIDRNEVLRRAIKEWLLSLDYPATGLSSSINDILQYDDWGYTDMNKFCNWLLSTYGNYHSKDITPQELQLWLRRRIIGYTQPDPFVHSALRSVGSRFKTVLASNGSSFSQRAKLQQAKLESFFQPNAIFISGEMGCEKPDPQFFKKIIREQQLIPERTMVIGDSPVHDIQAAIACGLLTCWVSHGRDETENIRPHRIISHIIEISTWSKPSI